MSERASVNERIFNKLCCICLICFLESEIKKSYRSKKIHHTVLCQYITCILFFHICDIFGKLKGPTDQVLNRSYHKAEKYFITLYILSMFCVKISRQSDSSDLKTLT